MKDTLTDTGETLFDSYQRLEYEHITSAHFRTMDSISAFFRYYLLLMALPISTMAVLIGFGSTDNGVNEIFDLLRIPGAIITFVFAIVGILVMMYVSNLRMDVILYAQTVNAIRKYFYDSSDLSIERQFTYRVLPQSRFRPDYSEPAYFLPVIFTFALLNSLYFLAAFHLLHDIQIWPLLAVSASIAFIFLHYVAYRALAYHREYDYLKSASLGVDIDGVLNKHREQFSKLLGQQFEISLDPEDIVTLPIHEEAGRVSREHEVAIFNDPKYWATMPPLKEAARNIHKIRNMLNLRVYFFTHRPWPDVTGLSIDEKKEVVRLWKATARKFLNQAGLKFLAKVALWARIQCGQMRPLEAITRIWLDDMGFGPHTLLIERGHENLAHPATTFSNRFTAARKRRIRFFVEDDPEKANKMAAICDVVFLVDHPYNRKKEVLRNVLRVNSWDDIYKKIRSLS